MSGRYLPVADTTVTPPPINRPDPLENLRYLTFKITRGWNIPDEVALLRIADQIGDITTWATGVTGDTNLYLSKVELLALAIVAEGMPDRIKSQQFTVRQKNGWADTPEGCQAFVQRVKPGLIRAGCDPLQSADLISTALGCWSKTQWCYWPGDSDSAEKRFYAYLKEHPVMNADETRIDALRAVLNPLYVKWEIDTLRDPWAVNNYLKGCFNQMDFKALCETPDPLYTPEYIGATFDAYVATTAKGQAILAKKAAQPAETKPGDEIPFTVDTSAVQQVLEKHADEKSTETPQRGDSSDEGKPLPEVADKPIAPEIPHGSNGNAAPTSETVNAEPSEADLKTFQDEAKEIVRLHHPEELTFQLTTLKADWEAAWDNKSSKDALIAWGHDEAIKRLNAYYAKPAPTSTALTVVDSQPASVVPHAPAAMSLRMPSPEQFQMMQAFAQAVAKSGLYKDVNTPEKAFVILWRGFELGVCFGTALDDIYIVKGKPYPGTKILKGLVEASGQVQRFEVLGDETSATVTVQRKGRPNISTFTYSMDDARKAKLVGNTENDSAWSKSPKKMLKWRACRDAILTEFPDIAMGIGISQDDEDEEAA